jgi:hypothetical protein
VGDGSQRLGEEGLRSAVADHITRHPGWREDPDALLASINAHAEELNGGELVDDVALLMVGARAGTTGGA